MTLGKRKREYTKVKFDIDEDARYLPPGYEDDGYGSDASKWQHYVTDAGSLAKAVYTRGKKRDVGGYEYRSVDGKDNDAYGLWVNEKTHHAYVVFKGTDAGKEWLLQNPSIARGTVKRNPYFWDAYKFYEKSTKSLGSEYTVDVTGHSLGGAKAMYVAAQAEKKGRNVHSITFNPGVGHSVREKIYGDMSVMPSKKNNLIVRNGDDVVSMMQGKGKANTITYTNTYQSAIDKMRPSWKVNQHSIDQFSWDNKNIYGDFERGYTESFEENSVGDEKDEDEMIRNGRFRIPIPVPRWMVPEGTEIEGPHGSPMGGTQDVDPGPGPTWDDVFGNLPGGQGGVRNPGTWYETGGYVDPYERPNWKPGHGSRYKDDADRQYFKDWGLGDRKDMTPEMRDAYDELEKSTNYGFKDRPLNPANGMHAHPDTWTPTVPPRNEQPVPPGQPGDYNPPHAGPQEGGRGDPHEPHEGVMGPEDDQKNNDYLAYLNHDAHNPVHAPSETMSTSAYTEAISRFANNAFGNSKTMSSKGMSFARFAELSDINGSMAEHARDMLAD